MQVRHLIPLLLLALGGIFFLGAGITGFAVAKTGYAMTAKEWSSFGIAAVIIAVIAYLLLRKKRQ